MSPRPDLQCEQRLWSRGCRWVAGIDEAGRGAWAGPVVAAFVILPRYLSSVRAILFSVNDSKLLSARARERCYDLIVETALCYGVGAASSDEIDRMGIVPATRLAMDRAILRAPVRPDYLLIDALPLPGVDCAQCAIIKGDRHCLSIAAASIVAKVTRDRRMIALGKRLPGYGWDRNKGYGTREHRRALYKLGVTSYHRHSFAPFRALRRVTTDGCE
ncbi:MAG: ribonuclease HII [Chloroflexota bacterium]|nr:ribonuclease HII [Chloroflexota bacterium]